MWETASCEQLNSLNGAQTVEARSDQLSFPRYSNAAGVTAGDGATLFPIMSV